MQKRNIKTLGQGKPEGSTNISGRGGPDRPLSVKKFATPRYPAIGPDKPDGRNVGKVSR
jgi:hypothetical protein